MNHQYVLLGFFTVILAILFQLFQSMMTPAYAFIAAVLATTLIVLGLLGLREGISHDTHFDALQMRGAVRIRPRGDYNDSTLFEFTPDNNTTYSITGRAYGSIN